MKKPALIITTLMFLVIALVVARVAVSNGLSTSGIAIKTTEDNVSSYKRENLILQEKLLTASSYTQIASKASEIGFLPSKANFVVGSSTTIAIRQ